MSSSCVQEQARKLYRGQALAPMVRASTIPLRALALKYGADFVYTEELVDRAITATHRVVNERLGTIDYVKDTSTMSKKQKRKIEAAGGPPILLRIDASLERGRLVCQIGTGEPELALEAALHVCKDVNAIDINMGCPKKFSVNGGMGSALLTDPERAASIIRTLRTHVQIPVSAKIRLLKDTASTVEFCQALIEAGVCAIAVHGRRVGDESTRPADWETLKEVVQLLKSREPSLPVLVNGDFYTRQEWMDFQAKSGADGVLLARPALYNTSIFVKPTDSNVSFGYDSPLLLSKTKVIQDYLRQAIRYDTHYKNVKYVVCEMMNIRRAPTPRLIHLKYEFDGKQSIGSVCQCHSMTAMCKEWNISDAITTNGVQPQAGEHVYKDSYFFVDKQKQNGKTGAEFDGSSKRARLDEPSSN